jgi:hypothetical protein
MGETVFLSACDANRLTLPFLPRLRPAANDGSFFEKRRSAAAPPDSPHAAAAITRTLEPADQTRTSGLPRVRKRHPGRRGHSRGLTIKKGRGAQSRAHDHVSFAQAAITSRRRKSNNVSIAEPTQARFQIATAPEIEPAVARESRRRSARRLSSLECAGLRSRASRAAPLTAASCDTVSVKQEGTCQPQQQKT